MIKNSKIFILKLFSIKTSLEKAKKNIYNLIFFVLLKINFENII